MIVDELILEIIDWAQYESELLLVFIDVKIMLNCQAHCIPNEWIINEGIIIISKSSNTINAGEIISIKNNKLNKVLINSIRQWLKFILL